MNQQLHHRFVIRHQRTPSGNRPHQFDAATRKRHATPTNALPETHQSATGKSPRCYQIQGLNTGDKPATVKVNYPDGSSETVDITVTVTSDADKYDPQGKNQTVENNSKPKPEDSISNKNDLPGGTIYEWVDEPDTSTPGDKPVTVKVIYPDGSSEEVDVTITVTPLADSHDPGYEDASVKPGKTATVGQTKDTLPEGTTFTIDPNYQIPDGWDIKVNPSTGEVTYTAPKGAKEGDKHTVPVIVTYRDKSTDETTSTITVLAPDATQADENNPGYKPGETTPGNPVSIDQDGDVDMPEGTKYAPEGDGTDGWKFEVDENTGKVTVTPPADANPGDKGEFKVTVTYPDGSEDTADVVVTVTDPKDGGNGDGGNGDGGNGDGGNGNGDGDATPTPTNPGNGGNGEGDGGNGDGGDTNTPTKRPDFSGLPDDGDRNGTGNGDDKDSGDKSDNSDKPSGAKVVDNGNKGDGTGTGGTGNGGVKGGFQPVPPANPSRVNQAPTAPSGIAPISGPGVGALIGAGGAGAAGKGAIVDTGGNVQESIWTKIANLFR